jgi:hypothetical protein
MADFLLGRAELERRLLQIASEAPQEVARALYAEAQIEANESKRRTPVDTGSLRASHEVQRPQVNGRDISVDITVGGPAAPYAIVVHEDLEADHPVGRARFLASTLEESAPHMAQRLSKRIDLNRMAQK